MAKKMLVAIDESDYAKKIARYVADCVKPTVEIVLFSVLPTISSKLERELYHPLFAEKMGDLRAITAEKFPRSSFRNIRPIITAADSKPVSSSHKALYHSGRTLFKTLSAPIALLMVYYAQKLRDCYGLFGTGLLAFATSYAAYAAYRLDYLPKVMRAAECRRLLCFLDQLRDMTRAHAYTCAATGAESLVHHGEPVIPH
jgi:hypothetical protein